MERKETESEKKLKRLITIPMAAERYHVASKTISQWIYLKKIPYIRIRGHRTMLDLDELERWEREGFHDARR